MIVRLIKKENGLFPFDPQSEKYLKRANEKDFFEVNITKKRNPRFHRKYYAMLRVVSEQLDIKIEDLHDFIKDKLGMYDVVLVGNMTMKRYHSISFATMDEIEFGEYYDRSLDILSDLLGLEYDELVAELDAEY